MLTDFMACDLGGTRTKVGLFNGFSWQVEVFPTAPTKEGWRYQLSQFYKQYQPAHWGLALPGLIDPKTGDWLRASVFNRHSWSRAELEYWLEEALPKPAIITTDMNATAWAVFGKTSGTLLQLSTGTGVRVIENGVILIDPKTPSMGLLASSRGRQVTHRGQTKSFEEWLSLRGVRSRAGRQGKILALLEEMEEIDLYLSVLKEWLRLLEGSSPYPQPIYLSGGCALGLRAKIAASLQKEGIEVRFVDNAEKIGLQGIYQAYIRGLRKESLYRRQMPVS